MARREITGRKPGVSADEADRDLGGELDDPADIEPRPHPALRTVVRAKVRAARGPPEAAEADVQTIPQFCAKHAISESFYYKLRARGLAPRELRLGARVLITNEAAVDWRRAQEARTSADTAA